MKCLACCTTRSKALRRFAGALSVLVFCAIWWPSSAGGFSGSSAEDTPAGLSVADIVNLNSIQRPGNPTFHLQMMFQVYDFSAAPLEQGSMEYWWGGDRGTYLEIKAPSVGTVHSTLLDQVSSETGKRTLFFADALLEAFRAPAFVIGSSTADVKAENRAMGTVALECLHRVQPAAVPVEASEVCADKKTGTIRVIRTLTNSVIRNQVGTFGKTQVALDLQLSWAGLKGVTGKVTSLQGFDPAKNAIMLEPPKEVAAAADKAKMTLGHSVTAGKRTAGFEPVYPSIAKQARVSGSVLLQATIDENGKVINYFPIETASPLLVGAAEDAVKTWTYQPYLLNGKPTRVNTTITVNFNLR